MKPVPVIKWMIRLTIALALIASAGFVAWHLKGDDLLREQILRHYRRKLDGWDLEIAHVDSDGGDVRLRNVRLCRHGSDQSLAEIPEAIVTVDLKTFMERGRVVVREVRLTRPILHVVRASDGTWNWQQLPELSESGTRPAECEIHDATIELALHSGSGLPPATLVFHKGKLHVASAEDQTVAFEGSASVPGAAALEISGSLDPKSRTWELRGHTNQSVGVGEMIEVARSTSPEFAQQFAILSERLETQFAALGSTTDAGAARTAHGARDTGFRVRSRIGGIPGPEIAGQLDVNFQLSGHPDDPIPRFQLLLNIRNGRIEHSVLPFPLHDVSGDLYWNNDYFMAKRVVAWNGPTKLRLGEIRVDRRSPQQSVQIETRVTGLPLDERLRRVMPTSWRRAWDPMHARGTVDVTARVMSDGTGGWRSNGIEVRVAGGSARHDKFAYPIENITGTIRQQPETQLLEFSLDGLAGHRPVRIAGYILDPGAQAEWKVRIETDRLPIDNTFLEACNEQQRGVLEALQPDGSADIRLELDQPRGIVRKPRQTLAVSLRDGSLTFRAFPYRITQVTGKVGYSAASRRWIFQDLRGVHDGTLITANGSYQLHENPGLLRLDIAAQNGRFERDLFMALSPDFQSVWRMLSPRGRLDLALKLTWRPAPGEPVNIEITEATIRDGRLRLKPFPYELTDVQTSLAYTSGRADIRSLSGRHGSAILNMRGFVEFEADGDWWVHLNDVSAVQVRPDDKLLRALPEALRIGVEKLDPTAPFSIVNGEMEFHGNCLTDEAPTAAWECQTLPGGGSLNAGLLLENVHGRITSRGTWDGRKLQNHGHIELDSFDLLGHRLTNIRGPYRIDNDMLIIGSEQIFRSKNLSRVPPEERITAGAYAGKLKLDARVSLRDPNRYELYATMDEGLLEQYAQINLPDQKNLRGIMRGWIHVNGDGSSDQTATGRGQLQISPAALYELPVIVRVFEQLSSLSLAIPSKTAFEYAIANFTIDNGAFHFNPVDLVGASISMRGQGVVDFDGRIAMDIYSRPPVRSRNLLNALVNEGYRDWVAVNVRGTVDQPRARLHSGFKLDEALRAFLAPFNPNPRGAPRFVFPNLIPPILGTPTALLPAFAPGTRRSNDSASRPTRPLR